METVTSVRRSNLRSVICPGCGRVRELTDRHVRRSEVEKTLCNLCRFPARRLPPTNTERRYWLRRFSDDQIVEMAESCFGGTADRANIYAWRLRLDIKEP